MAEPGSIAGEARVVRAPDRALLAVGALLFVAATAATIRWCQPMAGGMRMPGGWTLSMTWMRMPGESWLVASAAFLRMWTAMMVAMMLPTLVPRLASYARAARALGVLAPARLTALAGAGYFLVWGIVGGLAFPLGLAVAAAEMRWPAVARAVPLAAGAALVLAAAIQLSPWKDRRLGRCRNEAACASPRPGIRGAWRDGLRLGWDCTLCCAGYMLALFVVGVMDLRAMVLIAAAITLERLAPRPRLYARAAGLAILAIGVVAIARAVVAV